MFKNYIEDFSNILKNSVITDNQGNELDKDSSIRILIGQFLGIKKNGGTVYLVGNGGSSGIVSHSSVDFINSCKMKANPLTDNSLLTCMANDFGYENVFSQPLKTLMTDNDILIAVSSSGNSQNIVNAANICNEKSGYLITLSGFKSDNKLRQTGKINIWVNSMEYGKVEIAHALLLHLITDEIQNSL